MTEQTKFILDDSRLPKAWYNINADMPVPPAPVLHPGTLEPVTPDFLGVLFPMGLIMQEISTERYIEIPEPVRDVYRMWRPTPFLRAEGIIPAPESTHAIAVAIEEALACKQSGEKKVIAFNLSGHGHFDMAAYDSYLKGNLEDYDYPAAAVAEALHHLPQVG